MSFTTTIEKRADNRIFAGNDPAHTATGVSGITAMLDDTTGKLVAWDGQKAGTAVGVLALELDGSENLLTYWKSGTFATESLAWPKSVDAIKQANAFAGSAVSHAALP